MKKRGTCGWAGGRGGLKKWENAFGIDETRWKRGQWSVAINFHENFSPTITYAKTLRAYVHAKFSIMRPLTGCGGEFRDEGRWRFGWRGPAKRQWAVDKSMIYGDPAALVLKSYFWAPLWPLRPSCSTPRWFSEGSDNRTMTPARLR